MGGDSNDAAAPSGFSAARYVGGQRPESTDHPGPTVLVPTSDVRVLDRSFNSVESSRGICFSPGGGPIPWARRGDPKAIRDFEFALRARVKVIFIHLTMGIKVAGHAWSEPVADGGRPTPGKPHRGMPAPLVTALTRLVIGPRDQEVGGNDGKGPSPTNRGGCGCGNTYSGDRDIR